MTPAMSTSPVRSRTASTSTSTASSRKRSTSSGRSADTPPSSSERRPPGRPRPARGDRRRRRSPSPGRRARSSAARGPGSRSCGPRQGLVDVDAVPPAGWGMPRRSQRAFQRSRSSARSIDAGLVPSTCAGSRAWASLRGVWPPRLTMTPTSARRPGSGGDLGVEDVGDVLRCEGLEVQAVRGVVVGRDGLGVAVHHHRLVAGRLERQAGVDTAVVELDALADPVRARAEDDHAAAGARPYLVLVLVGGVVVRGARLELGRAGVDGLERGPHPERPARAGPAPRLSALPTTDKRAGRRRSRGA